MSRIVSGLPRRSAAGGWALAALAAFCAVAPVRAQTNNPGAQIEQAVRRATPQPGALAPGEEEGFGEAIAVPGGVDPGQSFVLGGVRLIGRDGAPLGAEAHLPLDDLRAILSAGVGAETTAGEILVRLRDAGALLRDRGYLFTDIAWPDAAAQLRRPAPVPLDILIAGVTIETIEVAEPEGPIGPAIAQVRRMAAPLAGLVNPRIEDLERVSLLITDIPGIDRATFVPSLGAAPGLIRMSLNVQRSPFSGVVLVDNRQGDVVGPWLFGAVGSWNSHTAHGGTTELAWFNSFGDGSSGFDFNERNTLQLKHTGYFGEDGDRAMARILYSRTKPSDESAAADLSTGEWEIEAQGEHAFRRTRALSLWGYAGWEYVDTETKETSSDTKLTDETFHVPYFGGRVVQRDADGSTQAYGELRVGVDVRGSVPSRTDVRSSFVYFVGEVERVQLLGDTPFSLLGRAMLQVADGALPLHEEMSVGGGLYGKAFDPSEATGDSGVALYGELRWDHDFDLQGRTVGFQVYAFGDYARLENLDGGIPATDELVSAGAGVRFFLDTRTDLEFEIARPINTVLDRNQERDLRFFVGLSQRF